MAEGAIRRPSQGGPTFTPPDVAGIPAPEETVMICAVDGGSDEGRTLMTLRFSVAATALPAVLDVLKDWEEEGRRVPDARGTSRASRRDVVITDRDFQ